MSSAEAINAAATMRSSVNPADRQIRLGLFSAGVLTTVAPFLTRILFAFAGVLAGILARFGSFATGVLTAVASLTARTLFAITGALASAGTVCHVGERGCDDQYAGQAQGDDCGELSDHGSLSPMFWLCLHGGVGPGAVAGASPCFRSMGGSGGQSTSSGSPGFQVLS
jgi:hypothetical protein